MPLIHVYSPAGTFDAAGRDGLAEQLTQLGMRCERLPAVPFVRSVVWLYFHDVPVSHVYHAGKAGGGAVVTVVWHIFEGGFDAAATQTALQETTTAVVKHGHLPTSPAPAPVFVLVREVPASSWAVSGEQGSLQALRDTPAHKPALP